MHKQDRNLVRIKKSVEAALNNGRRLLNDAEFLKHEDPPATAYFLTLIAQEEFAKAFLLTLVCRKIIPWNRYILRATKDHTCKQLLCLVLDFLNPNHEEFIERVNAVVLRPEIPNFPKKVADAIDILRYEKIGRWIARNWFGPHDPNYDNGAIKVADGRRDREKQDLLYVRLASDGGVATVAGQMQHDLPHETDRAERFASLIERFLDGSDHPGLDYKKVEEVFRLLFSVSERNGT